MLIDDDEFELRQSYVKYLDPATKFIPLKDNSKAPATVHGHHDGTTALPASKNWGIVRNGLYLVVDFDEDTRQRQSFASKLPPTWMQETPRLEGRGEHWLYKLPQNIVEDMKSLRFPQSVKIEGVGELKIGGAFPGPGSTIDSRPYKLVNNVKPIIAPDWLLERFYEASRGLKAISMSDLYQERDMIPDGERDNALVKLAGYLRGPMGFSETAIKTAISSFLDAGLVEQPEGREVTVEDAERIARSIAGHDTELPTNALDNVSCGVDFNLPLFDWYIYGFVLRGGYLQTGFAPGGTGKSSFGHYLANVVTNAGDNFLVVNHEDTPEYWKVCAVASGADRTKLYSHNRPLSLKMPAAVKELEEIITKLNIKFVWFDSIKDHMPTGKGGDAQDNARAGLSPLADLASRTGCLILGIFHTNKKGLPGGSTAFMDVSRHTIEFKREKGGPLGIKVEKTNALDPEYALRIKGEKKALIDPLDSSKRALERKEDGSVEVREVWISTGYEKDSKLLKEMEKEKERVLLAEKIKDMKESGMTQEQIAESLGIDQSSVSRSLKKLGKVNVEDLR